MSMNRITLYFVKKKTAYKTVYDEEGKAIRIDIGPYYIQRYYYDSFIDSYDDFNSAPAGTVFNNPLKAAELCIFLNTQLLDNIDSLVKEKHE